MRMLGFICLYVFGGICLLLLIDAVRQIYCDLSHKEHESIDAGDHESVYFRVRSFVIRHVYLTYYSKNRV